MGKGISAIVSKFKLAIRLCFIIKISQPKKYSKMKFGLLIASALALVAQIQAGVGGLKYCKTNQQCPGGTCRFGFCSNLPVNPLTTCSKESDCDGGQICSSGICRSQCKGHSDCLDNAKGSYCNITTGQCGCKYNSHCGSRAYGPTCTEGLCQCKQDNDCQHNGNGPICDKKDLAAKYCSCKANADCKGNDDGQTCRLQRSDLNSFSGKFTCGCILSPDDCKGPGQGDCSYRTMKCE